MKTNLVPAGALVILSQGESIEYAVQHICRATREIDFGVLFGEWLLRNPESKMNVKTKYQDFCYVKEPYLFYLELLENGILEEVDYYELTAPCGSAELSGLGPEFNPAAPPEQKPSDK